MKENSEAVTAPPMPFLRWAGSKRQTLNQLLPFWNNGYERYVESFMGSACLYFAAKPNCALLSDINHDLIETFKIVKENVEELADTLLAIPKSEGNYYLLRELDPQSITPIQRAARFIYLNRFCFNGLYRTNLNGKFNVPFAPRKTGQLPTRGELRACSALLQSANLVCGDFETVISSQIRAGDFVYLDPPYAVENRRIFRQYGAQTFGLLDLGRLKKLLILIDEVRAKFVLSYADCSEIREEFSTWTMYETSVRRNIAGFAKHRRKDSEVILTNIDG